MQEMAHSYQSNLKIVVFFPFLVREWEWDLVVYSTLLLKPRSVFSVYVTDTVCYRKFLYLPHSSHVGSILS